VEPNVMTASNAVIIAHRAQHACGQRPPSLPGGGVGKLPDLAQ
jgi:hypothetical protein